MLNKRDSHFHVFVCFSQSFLLNWIRLWTRSSSTPAVWLNWSGTRGRVCTGCDSTPSSYSRAPFPSALSGHVLIRSPLYAYAKHSHTWSASEISVTLCSFIHQLAKPKNTQRPLFRDRPYEFSREERGQRNIHTLHFLAHIVGLFQTEKPSFSLLTLPAVDFGLFPWFFSIFFLAVSKQWFGSL